MSVFLTGQALQIAGTGTRKRLIKLKPFFSMHVVIYTVAVAVKIKPKHTQTNTQNKYMMYRSIQSNKEYLRQRIMGGKGGGGGEKKRKKKSVFLVKSLVWQRKN